MKYKIFLIIFLLSSCDDFDHKEEYDINKWIYLGKRTEYMVVTGGYIIWREKIDPKGGASMIFIPGNIPEEWKKGVING